MKRSIFFVVLLTCVFATASAQSVKTQDVVRPSSEQSLQELVTEVRQLRATLQRMNAALYRGQVLLERLKTQQMLVSRISSELAGLREDMQDLRTAQQRLKESLPRIQEGVDAGTKHPTEIVEIKRELEQLAEREQRLTVRESRLAADLESERAILNDLNNKLNALVEIEMTPK